MPRQTPNLYAPPAEVVTLDVEVPEDEGLKIDVAPEKVIVPEGRVLLLEDRDDFREVLRDHLSSRFQVTLAPSGVEGLREIRENAFDIILCDMMMPRMGGEMFYWAVTRSRPATAKRFIFFTGHKNNPELEFFFKRVNATVIIKPFKLTELDTTIDNILRSLL
jgi:two-component system, NtrC family, sensor kinase